MRLFDSTRTFWSRPSVQISLCGKSSRGVFAQSSLPTFKSSCLLFYSQKGRKLWFHLMPQMLLLPSLHTCPALQCHTHMGAHILVSLMAALAYNGAVVCARWLIAESMNIHPLWCGMRGWILSERRLTSENDLEGLRQCGKMMCMHEATFVAAGMLLWLLASMCMCV